MVRRFWGLWPLYGGEAVKRGVPDVQAYDRFNSVVCDGRAYRDEESFVPESCGNYRLNDGRHRVLYPDVGLSVRYRLIPLLVGWETHLNQPRRGANSTSSKT